MDTSNYQVQFLVILSTINAVYDWRCLYKRLQDLMLIVSVACLQMSFMLIQRFHYQIGHRRRRRRPSLRIPFRANLLLFIICVMFGYLVAAICGCFNSVLTSTFKAASLTSKAINLSDLTGNLARNTHQSMAEIIKAAELARWIINDHRPYGRYDYSYYSVGI